MEWEERERESSGPCFPSWFHPSGKPLVIAWVGPEAQRGHLPLAFWQKQQGTSPAWRQHTGVSHYPRQPCRCSEHASECIHGQLCCSTLTRDLTIETKATDITARSYSPRILQGRRHFEGPFQTVPLSHLSFQEICHKSDECPLIRATGHCKNGWHAQCARRGVCCTARNQQRHSHYKPFKQPGAHASWTG